MSKAMLTITQFVLYLGQNSCMQEIFIDFMQDRESGYWPVRPGIEF